MYAHDRWRTALACFGRDIMDMFSGSKKPWCLYVLRSCLKSKVFPPLHGSNVLPKHSTFSEVRGKGIKKPVALECMFCVHGSSLRSLYVARCCALAVIVVFPD